MHWFKHRRYEWMKTTRWSPSRTVFRVDTYMGVLDACRAGMGLAPLPCFLADGDPRLARVAPPNRDLDIGLWVLTHEALRHTARVRAFLDFMAQTIERVRPTLEGEEDGGRPAGPLRHGRRYRDGGVTRSPITKPTSTAPGGLNFGIPSLPLGRGRARFLTGRVFLSRACGELLGVENLQRLIKSPLVAGAMLMAMAALALILDNSSISWLYDRLSDHAGVGPGRHLHHR